MPLIMHHSIRQSRSGLLSQYKNRMDWMSTLTKLRTELCISWIVSLPSVTDKDYSAGKKNSDIDEQADIHLGRFPMAWDCIRFPLAEPVLHEYDTDNAS
jgi:hypothetical protein